MKIKYKQELYIQAFTLAEVLITLGVVGVVASITIPTMIRNIQDYQLQVAFKKFYSTLSQATSFIMNDNGNSMKGVCASDPNPTNCYADTYAKYLSTTKTCYQTAYYGNCFVNGTDRFLNGNVVPAGQHLNAAGFILNTGAFIGFRTMDPANCANNFNGRPNDVCTGGILDINGFKAPNMMGKDIYFFYVTANGISPAGANDVTECTSAGDGCAAKVILGQ